VRSRYAVNALKTQTSDELCAFVGVHCNNYFRKSRNITACTINCNPLVYGQNVYEMSQCFQIVKRYSVLKIGLFKTV